ncbi:enoyl-CoA hydratase/isomerase family protein [Sorangium sp. KYC3313]|uniref:enoyl-CoA hydratase/isomerase family protein n=1 Tax=Sorangium sp. KYC3313 TaxID=3449740 RepID=UPI003F8BC9A5
MTERAYTVLQASSAGGVLRLTLNNPWRKNAIGPAMVSELLDALAAGAADETVRCVVLTGAGDAFCAGGDFAQIAGAEGAPPPEMKGDYADLLLAFANSSKPIVARVNGHALGGGLGLVAASHFAIGARGAKLGTPEINVGLFPMMIMAVLQRHVSRRKLLEMMLLGQRLDADEAAQCGLLNKVVEPGALDAAVDEVTSAIASKSPIAVRLGLEAFAAQDDLDLESALPLLRERLAGCLATDDAREGLLAFLEKRKPRWSGK